MSAETLFVLAQIVGVVEFLFNVIGNGHSLLRSGNSAQRHF
jgi:hypothetical protein